MKNREEEWSKKKEKKKKEGKEEEEEEEEEKKRPTLWSHLQNQTHPQQNQIHPFVAISTCKTKPTYKKIFLYSSLCSPNQMGTICSKA